MPREWPATLLRGATRSLKDADTNNGGINNEKWILAKKDLSQKSLLNITYYVVGDTSKNKILVSLDNPHRNKVMSNFWGSLDAWEALDATQFRRYKSCLTIDFSH